MSAQTKFIWYSWKDMMLDTNALIRQLAIDEFTPDVIVGLSRGGLTPGVMLSHWFNLPFKPVHASLRDFPHWDTYLPKPSDNKVLIVDDICDSGETFEKMQGFIDARRRDNNEPMHPWAQECDIRFASLWWNNEVKFKPQYWVRDCAKDSENIWIHFPWEAWWSSPLEHPKLTDWNEGYDGVALNKPIRKKSSK